MPQADFISERSVMGWGNRGWIEIVEMILEVCENGALKTHVMYKCNLNSKQIMQYLDFLQNHKLVYATRDPPTSKRPLFVTAELGKKYINAYKQLESIFKKN